MTDPAATYADLVATASRRLAGAGVGSPTVDSVLLMLHVLGTDRAGFGAKARSEPSEAERADFDALVALRCARRPLQHLVGSAAFRSLELLCDERALVPRPETEIIAGYAIERLAEIRSPVVTDLCTGSGAIALALASEADDVQVWGTDISPDALELASENVRLFGLGGKVKLRQGDLFAALPKRLRGRLDMIVANPPYVCGGAIDALEPEVRDHDPVIALDGGADGMRVARRIIEEAPDWLAPGGSCLIELGEERQFETARNLAVDAGLDVGESVDDLNGRQRVFVATLAAGGGELGERPEALLASSQ